MRIPAQHTGRNSVFCRRRASEAAPSLVVLVLDNNTNSSTRSRSTSRRRVVVHGSKSSSSIRCCWTTRVSGSKKAARTRCGERSPVPLVKGFGGGGGGARGVASWMTSDCRAVVVESKKSSWRPLIEMKAIPGGGHLDDDWGCGGHGANGRVGQEEGEGEEEAAASASPAADLKGQQQQQQRDVPVYVMLPLDTVNADGIFRYASASWFLNGLKELKEGGIHGVAVDIWVRGLLCRVDTHTHVYVYICIEWMYRVVVRVY